MVFLNILQNSQEDTCAEAFFNKVTGLSLKTRLQHRCFPVNFAKLFKILILQKSTNDCFWTPAHFKGVFELLVILIKKRHIKNKFFEKIDVGCCPTFGSHPRVPPQGPGSWVATQGLGPTFLVCSALQACNFN